MEKLSLFLRRALWAVFLLLTLGGVFLGTLGNLEHLSYCAAFAVSCAVTACLILYKRRSEKTQHAGCAEIYTGAAIPTGGEKKETIILAVLCFAVNGGFVLLFHPLQAPDYQTFLEAAENLAAGTQLRNQAYLAMFPHIIGYAAFLSLFLRLFGGGIRTASLVNAGLTALSGAALYEIGFLSGGKKTGRIAAALWILCPSKLLFNAMSLSEPYYTCLLLFFFLLMMRMDRECGKLTAYKEGKDSLFNGKKVLVRFTCAGVVGGILAGFVNTARPIGIIPILAVVLWLFLLRRREGRYLQKAKYLLLMTAVMILTYAVLGSLWRNYEVRVLGEEPAGIPGYSIYVGFNTETGGSYADEDMELLQSRYYGEENRNAQQAQRRMMEDARTRIEENKGELPRLMLKKLGTLLGHDEAAVFYTKESLGPRVYSLLCIVCNVWYYCLCLLIIPACIDYGRTGEGSAILIIPLFVVGLVLAQLLVEVAARYHYAIIPILTLLAALSLGEPIKGRMSRTMECMVETGRT